MVALYVSYSYVHILFILTRPWRYLHSFIFHYLFTFHYLSYFIFYETILSSSPVLVRIHFILLYNFMLRYYYYIRVINMYTCLCIPVLVVMSSIVYLNHIISSTLFFRFLQSSYHTAQLSHETWMYLSY